MVLVLYLQRIVNRKYVKLSIKQMLLIIYITLIQLSISSAAPLCPALFTPESLPTIEEAETQITQILSALRSAKLKYLTDGNFQFLPEPNFKKFDSAQIEDIGYINGSSTLLYYQSDIFFSHYYYRNYGAHFAKEKRRNMTIQKFSLSQNWFKWNSDLRKYTLEIEGASESLLNKLPVKNNKITFYRGAFESEFNFMKGLSKLDRTDGIEAIRQNLQKTGTHKGYFFTPDLKAAQSWSKGAVVKVEMSKDDLIMLARLGKLYVGIEGPYVEAAFIDPESIFDLVSPKYILHSSEP